MSAGWLAHKIIAFYSASSFWACFCKAPATIQMSGNYRVVTTGESGVHTLSSVVRAG